MVLHERSNDELRALYARAWEKDLRERNRDRWVWPTFGWSLFALVTLIVTAFLVGGGAAVGIGAVAGGLWVLWWFLTFVVLMSRMPR